MNIAVASTKFETSSNNLHQIAGVKPRLETLVLHNTRIGDPGLVGLERLGKLRELSLWGTMVSDRGEGCGFALRAPVSTGNCRK